MVNTIGLSGRPRPTRCRHGAGDARTGGQQVGQLARLLFRSGISVGKHQRLGFTSDIGHAWLREGWAPCILSVDVVWSEAKLHDTRAQRCLAQLGLRYS
jgi:hypothetical protein